MPKVRPMRPLIRQRPSSASSLPSPWRHLPARPLQEQPTPATATRSIRCSAPGAATAKSPSTDGKTERLKCNAYYTGGGSQLGMAIRCQSESSNVEIRSKLSQSGGRITGTWEERTYNATGNASGQASTGKISLSISGGVSGTMLVSYSSSRQSVAISTQGIALKSVTIDLSRS